MKIKTDPTAIKNTREVIAVVGHALASDRAAIVPVRKIVASARISNER